MGMQQFESTVMVEVVSHRTPQANRVFDNLIDLTKSFELEGENLKGVYPVFHWGFDTENFDRTYLERTSLGLPYRVGSGLNRLDVFKIVKEYIRNGNEPIFDNAFVERMGL